MGEAYLDWQSKSGGIKLNDVIEEYRYVAAGKTIKAGDLVNYINGIAGEVDYGESTETQLDGEIYTGWRIAAAQLDDNRVFVAHSNGTSTSNMDIHAMILTVNGNSIEVGQDVTIINSSFSAQQLTACKLLGNKILLVYSYGSNNNLYAIVCEVEGDLITYGDNTVLSSVISSGYYIAAVTLSNGDVFIAHRYASEGYLYGMVVTVNGKAIEKGTDTRLIDAADKGSGISACLLQNGDVFIAHGHNNNTALYGMIVNINNKTITTGNDVLLDDTTPRGGLITSTCTLPNGDVFISYGAYGTEYYLYAIVCTISGMSIAIKTQKQLSNESRSGYRTNPFILPNGNIFLVHSKSNNGYLYGMILEVGDTIITGEDVLLNSTITSGNIISTVFMQNGTACVVHSHTSNKYYLYAQIFGIDYENNIPTNHIIATEYEEQVTPATQPPFNAVALSSGLGGTDTEHNQQVKIAKVYKEVVTEVTKTGNEFPTSWTGNDTYTKFSANGYTVEASSTDTNYYSYQACDSNLNTLWKPYAALTHWIQMTCPKPQKITKMNLKASMTYPKKVVIQGTNSNDWVDLYTINKDDMPNFYQLTEINLNNADFYKYYRIYFESSQSGTLTVTDWQTSEYIEKVTEVIQ